MDFEHGLRRVIQDSCRRKARGHSSEARKLSIIGEAKYEPRREQTDDCVTKRPGECYETFIERILPNPIACLVKIADLLDNMNLVRLGREITEKDVARLRKYQRPLARLTKQELSP